MIAVSTRKGYRIYDFNKTVVENDYDFLDSIEALSRINRYNNQSSVPYSVAEHLLHVGYYVKFYFWDICQKLGIETSKMTRQQYDYFRWSCELIAFTHDFEEALTGDIPTPVKRSVPEVRNFGDKIREDFYHQYHGFDTNSDFFKLCEKVLRYIDRSIVYNEAKTLGFFEASTDYWPDEGLKYKHDSGHYRFGCEFFLFYCIESLKSDKVFSVEDYQRLMAKKLAKQYKRLLEEEPQFAPNFEKSSSFRSSLL